VHWVVDEMVVGGMVAETNMNDILDAVESQARLARQEQGIGNGGVGAQGQPPSFWVLPLLRVSDHRPTASTALNLPPAWPHTLCPYDY
jgi:hypothetical protein